MNRDLMYRYYQGDTAVSPNRYFGLTVTDNNNNSSNDSGEMAVCNCNRSPETIKSTAVNKQTVNVATMMLDTAKTKRDQAMQSLEKIGQKRKLLTDKQHRLLEKAMSSTANAAKNESKAKVTQSAKRAKTV
ncbi:hypothetical protein ACROYT_G017994 [Oculina patagonica]